jgi:hypothetical protein
MPLVSHPTDSVDEPVKQALDAHSDRLAKIRRAAVYDFALAESGALKKLQERERCKASLVSQVDITKVRADQVGHIRDPAYEVPAGNQRRLGSFEQFEHSIFVINVFQDIGAEDPAEPTGVLTEKCQGVFMNKLDEFWNVLPRDLKLCIRKIDAGYLVLGAPGGSEPIDQESRPTTHVHNLRRRRKSRYGLSELTLVLTNTPAIVLLCQLLSRKHVAP